MRLFILLLRAVVLILSLFICYFQAHAESSMSLWDHYQHSDYPRSLWVHEIIPIKKLNSDEKIVIGNEKYGYFEVSYIKQHRNGLEVTFLPMGYKRPLEILILNQNSGQTKKIKKVTYSNPFPREYLNKKISVLGYLSTPFILVNWIVEEPKSKEKWTTVAIINNYGELIWLAPSSVISKGTESYYFRRVSDSQLIFRTSEGGKFVHIDFSGRLVKEIDLHQLRSHHTFKYLSRSNQIIALTHYLKKVNWYDDPASIFKGISGFLNLFRLPGRIFKGSSAQIISLDDGSMDEITNSFQTFSVSQDINRSYPAFTGEGQSDPFLDARSLSQYRRLCFNSVSGRCLTEWTHENSIDYDPRYGYLISARNLSKLVLVNIDTNKKITIGSDEHDDIVVRDEFSLQHDAKFLSDGSILLFDNHLSARGSHIASYSNNKILTLKLNLLKMTAESRQIDIPLPPASFGGNVELLENNNYFVFQPYVLGSFPQIWAGEVISEITADGKVRGEIHIPHETVPTGIYAQPFDALPGTTVTHSIKSRSEKKGVVQSKVSPTFSPERWY